MTAVETIAGAALFACCAWTSYVLAYRATSPGRVSERWSAAAIIALWLLVAVFLLLGSVSLFRLWVAVAVLAAGAVAAHARLGGRDALTRLGEDLLAARSVVAQVPRGFRVLLAAVLGVALVRTIRGLLAPPLAWDALTYHLVKAGRWVQTGGFAPEAAPDAWGYYEYFMPYGDVLWAWAMLPVRSDALLAPAGLLVWLTLVLGAYSSARALDARQEWALVGAGIVGSTPPVISYLASGYVENLTAAVFLLGAVFVTRAFRDGSDAAFVLAAGALGLGAGVKIVSLPYLVVGLALLAVAASRRRAAMRERAALVAWCALAAAIAVPPYARAWVEKGSPVYPLAVTVGGRVVAHGNEEMALVHSGRILPASGPATLVDTLESLVSPDPLRLYLGVEFTGLGPAVLLLLFLAAIGAARLVGDRGLRLPVAYLVAAGAIAFASILPESNTALRTFWIDSLGRHLIVPVAVLAVLAVARVDRASGIALFVAALVNLALAIPLGWGEPDASVLPLVAAWTLWAVGVALVAFYLRRRGRLGPALALGLVALLALPYLEIVELRDRSRYVYYARAARHELYDVHTLDPIAGAAWPIWQALDGERGVTIAATAGWNGIGHNWYRYPLLGSRLQNRVLYVPVTSDGGIVDYRDEAALAGRLDVAAWIERLAARGVDYVVILPPDPPEAEWVRANPNVFRPVVSDMRGQGTVYRFHRDRAPLRR